MANLSVVVANDITNAVLKHYTHGPALAQTIQEKPLLRMLQAGKRPFPAGNQYVSDAVQGTFMADQTNVVLGGGNFFQGYTASNQVNFAAGDAILRAEYKWYETHCGFVITWTELKIDGIVVTDDNNTSQNDGAAVDILTDVLENRLADFAESYARSINSMFWQDGTQDAYQTPGIRLLLPDDPTTGTAGGLSRVTYPWWRHQVRLGIVPSATAQTLTKTLRTVQRPLRRFGGKPSKFLCGSRFIDALELEVAEKGYYTQTGFTNSGATDIDMADISMRGIGNFEFDPTLDDLALANYCFEFDPRRLKMRPMQGCENKIDNPARPYQYFIFLKSMTMTSALSMTQANAQGVFSVNF